MSNVYTRRLAGPVITNSTTNVTFFTVPAGHTYVVKMILLTNSSAVNTAIFRVGFTPGVTMAGRIYGRTLAANEVVHLETLIPLVAGESLYGANSEATGVVVTLAGYDFVE